MRKKTIWLSIIVVSFAIVCYGLAIIRFSAASKSKLIVRAIDDTGIQVGDEKLGIAAQASGPNSYVRTVKALNEGWDLIKQGAQYKRAGQYDKAIAMYKKAWDVDPGNRGFIGLIMIETYELMSRYDDALKVLDELSKRRPISDYGIRKYSSMRARLLAAKAQTK